MPELGSWDYMSELFMEMGAGKDAQPISWGELLQWQEAAHVPLCLWEKKTLRAMSRNFITSAKEFDGVVVGSPMETEGKLHPTNLKQQTRNSLRNALKV